MTIFFVCNLNLNPSMYLFLPNIEEFFYEPNQNAIYLHEAVKNVENILCNNRRIICIMYAMF
ncbi:MAG: hypothetical protein K0Q53_2871 [Massilibacillus sp.]|jgi:hypothetical protein|nr:hypothetical protein [Massilibacillus sp.]